MNSWQMLSAVPHPYLLNTYHPCPVCVCWQLSASNACSSAWGCLAASPMCSKGLRCRGDGALRASMVPIAMTVESGKVNVPAFTLWMGQLWGTLYGIPRGPQQEGVPVAHSSDLLITHPLSASFPSPRHDWAFVGLPSCNWIIISEFALGGPNPRLVYVLEGLTAFLL